MRIALALTLLLGCASGRGQAGLAADTPTTARDAPAVARDAPAAAGDAPAAAGDAPGAAGDAPAVAGDAPGAAGDAPAASDDAPCSADADCAFTRYAPGACCPLLCAPRAVTRAGAAALEAHAGACKPKRECPEPVCRPPREETVPACVQGRCAAKVIAGGSS